jgi:ribosomal protein S18 acetylase RimI-like enzyme
LKKVSFIHTLTEAAEYIKAVNHPGVRHINGDLYHMQVEESHIGEAIVDAGDMLVNLHMADSNRCALGDGSLDLDTVLMALYLIGYNEGDKIIGFIAGEILNCFLPISKVKKVGYISGAYVMPQYRGKNVMKRLEQMLIRFFKSKNLRYAELNVMTMNASGKEIWSRLGYSTFREQMRKTI